MADEAPVAQEDRALDGVAQLADVARPGVAEEPFTRIARDPRGGPPHRAPEILEEGLGQREDVVGAGAERRDEDLEDVQR
jgi:hypothetical protein